MLRDWPALDALNGSVTSSATTLTVADSSLFKVNGFCEVDNETMWVRAKPTATTLTVRRAAWGSSAATHANDADVLVNPRFLAVEILDALNTAKDSAFPHIYQPVIDTSITIVADDYEYNIPDVSVTQDYPIPYLYQVESKASGADEYVPERGWRVQRHHTAPFIKFLRLPSAGATLRLFGIAPLPDLAFGGNLSELWPANAVDLLPIMAASYLTMSGEAARVRQDVGMNDQRENANRTGSSLRVSDALAQRFYVRLRHAGMPPVGPHLVRTI